MDADTADSNAATPTAGEAGTDRQLDLVWRRHRQWSHAANVARARLDRWRLSNLLLLVLGALAGAMAAQTWLRSGTATGFAIVAAAALALAGFIQAKALNAAQTTRWTRARAASEALKAEVYRYIIRVAPYAEVDRARLCWRSWIWCKPGRSHSLLTTRQDRPTTGRRLPCAPSRSI